MLVYVGAEHIFDAISSFLLFLQATDDLHNMFKQLFTETSRV